MDKIKDVEYSKVDDIMNAVGSVFKAVIAVAKCLDNLKNSRQAEVKPV